MVSIGENKKIIITAISIFILSMTAFALFDNIDGLFNKHEPREHPPPAGAIIVSGDGSSGTGDVTNKVIVGSDGRTYVVSGGTQVTTPPKETVTPPEKYIPEEEYIPPATLKDVPSAHST